MYTPVYIYIYSMSSNRNKTVPGWREAHPELGLARNRRMGGVRLNGQLEACLCIVLKFRCVLDEKLLAELN